MHYQQTRQVHVSRSVLGKIPRKPIKRIGDEVRSVFCALSNKSVVEILPFFKRVTDCNSHKVIDSTSNVFIILMGFTFLI